MKNYHGFRFNTSNKETSYIFIQHPKDLQLYYCHPYRGDDLSLYHNLQVGIWSVGEITRTILEGFWIPVKQEIKYKEEL
jgi:hypothetical protein